MRFAFLTIIFLAGYCIVFHMLPTDAEETFISSGQVSTVAMDGVVEPRIDPKTTGGKLFMENCARCHSAKLQKELTGPALWGVQERVDRESLAAWIKNSGKVLESGDPYFVALQKEYNGAVMDPMPHLKPEEIEAIIDEITVRSL